MAPSAVKPPGPATWALQTPADQRERCRRWLAAQVVEDSPRDDVILTLLFAAVQRVILLAALGVAVVGAHGLGWL